MSDQQTPISEIVAREKAFWEQRADEESFSRVRRWIRVSLGAFNRFEEVHSFYDPRGKRVLDYGCGSGELTFDLLARGAAHVTAFDISETLVERAAARADREGAAERTRFLVRDAHATGFDDDAFDLVVGVAILHHLRLEDALPEIRRVLKPGGKAVFVEPLAHNPILRLGRRLTPSARTPDEHPLTKDDWALCEQHFERFEHQEREVLTLLFVPLNWVLPRRAQIRVAEKLSALDDRLMAAVPALRKYARLTILELQ
jgi:SAM-dependent methyltransferase